MSINLINCLGKWVLAGLEFMTTFDEVATIVNRLPSYFPNDLIPPEDTDSSIVSTYPFYPFLLVFLVYFAFRMEI